MKHTRITACLLAVIMLLALSACGGQSAPESSSVRPPSEDTPITVTDMMGRRVTLDGPAQRVVTLSASDCEILYAIGAGEALVGRGEYCDYPPEVLEVPSVQSGAETNLEQILALQPQVLIMDAMAQPKEQVERLESAGVAVVVLNAQDIQGVYTAIELIGELTDRTEQAAFLIESMMTSFADIRKKAEGQAPGTIYFEVSPLEWGLWAAGSGTFMDEAAGLMGLTNCFADVEGWAPISEEQVLERDPDYILTIAMYDGQGPTPEGEIASRPGWENIAAVRNWAILNLPNDELSRPGPRLVDGARMLYEFVYETEQP